MAGMHPLTTTKFKCRKRRMSMHVLKFTPSIEVSIGRETRLYHAYITSGDEATHKRSSMNVPEDG